MTQAYTIHHDGWTVVVETDGRGLRQCDAKAKKAFLAAGIPRTVVDHYFGALEQQRARESSTVAGLEE